MISIALKWEIQRLQGCLPNKITNPCTFHEDYLYLIVDNFKQNDLYSLSLIDFKWRKLYNGIPFKARFNGQFVMKQEKMYCYGGSVDVEGSILLDEFLEIDVIQLKFRQIKSAPTGRVEHGMCIYRGQILILGGRTQKKIFNDCKTYTIGTDQWNQIEFEPAHRFGHQCTVYEDTIIVTGGSDGKTILEDVWLLIDLRTWIKLEIKNPVPLFRHQAVLAMKEYLIVFGGCSFDGKRCNDNFYALNIVTLKWIELPKVSRHPYPRMQHTMLCLLNQSHEDLLVIGGMNYQDLSILNFSQLRWPIWLIYNHNRLWLAIVVILLKGKNFYKIFLKKYKIPKKQHHFQNQVNIMNGKLKQIREQYLHQELDIQLYNVQIIYIYFVDQMILLFLMICIVIILLKNNGNQLYQKEHHLLHVQDVKEQQINLIYIILVDIQIEEENILMIYIYLIQNLNNGDKLKQIKIYNQELICQQQQIMVRYMYLVELMVQLDLMIYNVMIFNLNNGLNYKPMVKLLLQDLVIQQKYIKIKCMYLVDGMDLKHQMNQYLLILIQYTYSFASNYWYLEKLRSKPPSRYRHSSTLIGYSIFIFGGVDAAMTRYNDLYEFNCELKEWKFIETAGNTPSARTFHQLCSYETTIYLIGGNDGSKKNNDMYSIQVFDNRFSDLSSISQLEIQSNFIHKEHGLISILKSQVNELEQRLKEEQEFNLCSICQIKDINSVFLECGHRFCCYECSNKLEICKICLKKPGRIIKIYVV